MRFSTSAIIAALLGAAAVSAETFDVLVGKDGKLTYEPPSVNAKAGDVINFQFLSKNHTVTQSTFAAPCVVKADAVDSGFQFVPAGAAQIPAWSITINNDTAPLWFFCNQGPHCKAGMVFSVNPSAERTHEAFVASAAAGGGATSGPNAAAAASGAGGAAASAPANAGANTPSAASAESQQGPDNLTGAAVSRRSGGGSAMMWAAAGAVVGFVGLVL